jgi:RNA polymerase sigma factor (sigma-70 family)
MNPNESDASRLRSATTDRRGERDLDDLLVHVARGDQAAFEALYDRMVGPVYGVIRRVLRDPSQSGEVAQEVLLEVWRTAARFDPAMGSAATWALTIAHRRAVDRIRSTMAEPPPELRDRVMAAVARTPQLPPQVRTHAHGSRGTAPRRARPRHETAHHHPHNRPAPPRLSPPNSALIFYTERTVVPPSRHASSPSACAPNTCGLTRPLGSDCLACDRRFKDG